MDGCLPTERPIYQSLLEIIDKISTVPADYLQLCIICLTGAKSTYSRNKELSIAFGDRESSNLQPFYSMRIQECESLIKSLQV